ncbi:hypothetical protein F4820DRAFT_444742 [Hypoxylon rubiginosum]|uniref:Uncharacterized protein n=1 Tax=Hypoxylon rubiginosum TaxID=110542 RepID=A0ACB9ZBR2_9PEZI|nr:hypothetical protein F4820DRAFT_444742 [Hypoxylon rubiginosum]
MARMNLVNLGQRARAHLTINHRGLVTNFGPSVAMRSALPRQHSSTRSFSVSTRAGLPLSADALKAAKVASITNAEYHQLSNKYLDAVLTKYEELQDKDGDIDVEFSSGVMTIKIPGSGTYIVNKQPPNKQIWLSSPVSGPKRYDWVILSEGQDQKQDTASGDWVYLRDGSTLSELLLKETGVVMDQPGVGSDE